MADYIGLKLLVTKQIEITKTIQTDVKDMLKALQEELIDIRKHMEQLTQEVRELVDEDADDNMSEYTLQDEDEGEEDNVSEMEGVEMLTIVLPARSLRSDHGPNSPVD